MLNLMQSLNWQKVQAVLRTHRVITSRRMTSSSVARMLDVGYQTWRRGVDEKRSADTPVRHSSFVVRALARSAPRQVHRRDRNAAEVRLKSSATPLAVQGRSTARVRITARAQARNRRKGSQGPQRIELQCSVPSSSLIRFAHPAGSLWLSVSLRSALLLLLLLPVQVSGAPPSKIRNQHSAIEYSLGPREVVRDSARGSRHGPPRALPAVLRSSVAGGPARSATQQRCRRGKDNRKSPAVSGQSLRGHRKVSRAEGWRRDRQPDGWAQPDNAGNRASGPMAR
jgi:hypothetical protein